MEFLILGTPLEVPIEKELYMSLVESMDIPLGTKLSAFSLPDPDGGLHDSDKLFGKKGLLLVVTCNHCPYALAIWPRVIRLAGQAHKLGVNTVAINPNIHQDYPEDAPERMRDKIREWQIRFPYLVDETQNVAKSLKAQCTPDLYLFDNKHELVYHGRIDDNWRDASKITKQELKEAIEHLAKDEPITAKQHHSMGCSIKWH